MSLYFCYCVEMEADIEALRARLFKLRTGKKISARALSMAIGKSEAYIQGLESGLRNKEVPKEPIVRAIARELGTTVDYLVYGIKAERQDEAEKSPRKRYTLQEILRNIGAWRVVDNSIALDQEVSAHSRKGGHIPSGLADVETLPLVNGRQLYAVRVTGDCMAPSVNPGDTILFDPERPAQDGDMVVAAKDGERALVKWLDDRGTVQYLLPRNGEPILIDESIEVVGVVEDIKRKPERLPRSVRSRPVSPLQRPLLDE